MLTAMLAAALLGGYVFAADYIPTYCKGPTAVEKNDYFGVYSSTESVGEGKLDIFRLNDTGPDMRSSNFYGGFSSADAAAGNTVTMSSGEVGTITGGAAQSVAAQNIVTVSDGIILTITGGTAQGQANKNTIAVDGGQVGAIIGGEAQSSASGNIITVTAGTVDSITGGKGAIGSALDNVITVTGGTVGAIVGGAGGDVAYANTVTVTGGTVGSITGGMGWEAPHNTVIVAGGTVEHDIIGGACEIRDIGQNKVILVGEGAKYGEGAGEIYGSAFSVGGSIMAVTGAEPTAREGIDIYGAGITVGGAMGGAAEINFHLTGNLLDSGAAPMLTMTSKEASLDFGSFELTFQAADEMDWMPGDSVTLVEAQKGMSIAQEVLGKEYNIYQNGDPQKTVMATAKLAIEQGQGDTQYLKLTVQGSVPEPATGTLSLLALAGLAARRRKK